MRDVAALPTIDELRQYVPQGDWVIDHGIETWPDAKTLYRATKDGTFSVSTDGGTRWEDVGKVGGEPYEIHAVGPNHAFVALSDGSIIETQDGGATWRDRFRP